MSAFIKGSVSVAAIIAAAGAGLWAGQTGMIKLPLTSAAAMPEEHPAPTGPVIYYRDPGGKPFYSLTPHTTEDGRAYLTVRASEDVSFDPKSKEKVAKLAAATNAGKTIKYYRNPMGLPDTSPVPKKDSMGMDYIPVYEGEDSDDGSVKVSPGKIQRAGVRSEPAEMRRLVRPIRAPGIAKPDERTLLSISLRADSFIEKLYANETGRHVKAGEPLFRIYSPDMVKVQVDYRISTSATGNRDEKGALQRLQNLQLPQAVMDELRRTREPVISFDWPSPVSGVVMKKQAVEGMMMRAGEELMMLADLASIWVIADVPEQDIGQIRIGSTAKVTFRAFPNEVFDGRVNFVLHELEMATRTAKVRIEVDNPEYRIKHEMFADVEIDAGEGEPARTAVPISALIDSGNRQVVIIDRGEGRFEPRSVKVGLRGEGYVEIVEGVEAGENVVVAANFLIDAESNLKAALSGFTADTPKDAQQPGAAIERTP